MLNEGQKPIQEEPQDKKVQEKNAENQQQKDKKQQELKKVANLEKSECFSDFNSMTICLGC